MPLLTVSAAQRLDDEAATLSIREIAAYLQEAVGQRVAAAMAARTTSVKSVVSMAAAGHRGATPRPSRSSRSPRSGIELSRWPPLAVHAGFGNGASGSRRRRASSHDWTMKSIPPPVA
jgi:hypothetical protein